MDTHFGCVTMSLEIVIESGYSITVTSVHMRIVRYIRKKRSIALKVTEKGNAGPDQTVSKNSNVT